MKALSITAGAAGMYCGSCLRDNALAAELLSRGHDVTLLPLYTPTLTDEPNVSAPRVLFGGLSVYLQQRVPLFRRTPRMLDRLLDSPRVIAAVASRSVSTDPALLGDMTVSMLEGPRGVLRKEFDKLAEWIRGEPPPDVVNLPNSLLIGLAEPLRAVTGRSVCCTLQGEELFLAGLPTSSRDRALELIRAAVPHVDRFVAVSDYCARFMSDLLRIPPQQIAVVPLGINMSDFGGHVLRQTSGTFRVGYLARVAPEKGLHVLADAYVRFRRRTGPDLAELTAAGYLAPSQARYLEDARRILEREGLAHEFSYEGTLDRDAKIRFLRGLDVFSVPATYDEPKGLFLLEAMASGVPVVQPRRGAFTEMVDRTGGGLLVAPDDPAALADGLYTMYIDATARARFGRQASDGVRAHYTVAASADRLLDVYSALLRDRGASASLASS